MNSFQEIKLLNKYLTVDIWSKSSSFLHSAVLHGDIHKVYQIINEKNIDVNVEDDWQRTALFYAVLINNCQLVQLLLESDAKVELFDIHHKSPLHAATEKGYHGCLKILLPALEKIYNLKDVDDGATAASYVDGSGVHPFHLAAKFHTTKCLQILLQYSFLGNIDCVDKNKTTPLHWAAAYGVEKNVVYLLKHKVDPSCVDDEGKVALHWAALSLKEGSKECLQALVGIAPFHINKQDLNGATPLHLAVLAGHEEKVEFLLSNKICLVDAITTKDQSSLHYACSQGFLEIVKKLIVFGAAINKEDIFGATPLHYAALHNHFHIIKMILQLNREEATTLEDGTALHWEVDGGAKAELPLLKAHSSSNKKAQRAAKKKDGLPSSVEMLKMKALTTNTAPPVPLHYSVQGFPIDSPDAYGRSPLHLMAFVGYCDVLCLLLQNKANVNARDNEDKTALHWASGEGHVDAVRTLLNYGASLNYIDATKGRLTPLDYAIKTDKKEVIETLTCAGALTFSTLKDIAARFIQCNWRNYLHRKSNGESLRLETSPAHYDPSPNSRHRHSRDVSTLAKQDLMLTPLTTPYFSHEMSEFEDHHGNEKEHAGNTHIDSEFSKGERRSSITGDEIVRNDATGVCVRLAQGEELAAAESAWLQRISGLDLIKSASSERNVPN